MKEFSSSNGTFVLEDGEYELMVFYNKSLPSNFETGKDVVVKGKFLMEETDGEEPFYFIKATDVDVGCASKYG